jgi:hypothetical protein
MKQKEHTRDEGDQPGPHTVPSSEVGRGAGLDPQSAAPEREGDPRDEAVADRPSRRAVEDEYEEGDGAAIQRPPADS